MNKTHSVKLPTLKAQHFTTKKLSKFTSIIRQGGIRLEQQMINDKHVYHNYGQGQSEVSLGYGCGYIVSKMITLKKVNTKTKDVAVVGDGINALLTTLELSKRGHKVTLYTSKLTGLKNGPQTKKPTFSQGLQFWYPNFYDNCDPLKHQLLSKLSFQFLHYCLTTNRYQSLKQVPLYCTGPKSQQLLQTITQFITKQIYPITINFSNLKQQQYTYFNTIMINTELFVEQLYTQLQLRSTYIEEKQFNTIEDIIKLKEQFVYDCMGIKVKNIFGDKLVKEVRNFNIVIENKVGERGGWDVENQCIVWVSSQAENEEDYIVYFTKKKIQISSSNKFDKDYHENLEKWSEKLIARAYHFVKERTAQPSKL